MNYQIHQRVRLFVLRNQNKKNRTYMLKYSIVTAVYNVAPYLDAFFKSITRQTLDFEKNIVVILVDDGSTDNSEEIIQRWKSKYPDNILYIRKENGGQASARNLGLTYAKTPWVTFIDPDDFVNKNYFKKVDSTLVRYKDSNISMVACNIRYYFEKYGITIDKHPLRYKFKTTTAPIGVKHLDTYIQLSVSSAFFKTALICNIKLQFDSRIKPNFEDAHFLNRYLIAHHKTSVVFIKESIYYYRRRKKKTSTIDTSWKKYELFDDVLNFGCLDLFQQAKANLGYIPSFLQRAILYHLSWYFKYMVDHPEFAHFLTEQQRQRFQQLLVQIFDDISMKTIEAFDLSGIDDLIRSGWAHYYKKCSLSKQTIYLSRSSKVLHMNYYAVSPLALEIKIDDHLIECEELSNDTHTFLNEPFIREYRLEVPLKRSMKTLSIRYNKEIRLHTGKQDFNDKIQIKQIGQSDMKQIKQKLYRYAKNILLGN